MTNRDDLNDQPGNDAGQKKFFEDEDRRLPEAIYPLGDGSYDDRETYDAECEGLEDAESALWGQGALLLNPSTKSYLTPYGFKALFEEQPDMIQERFERAGLDPEKRYFQENTPNILIHCADGRFVPSYHMPGEPGRESLLLRFSEDDIYLQNFSHKGSRHTGSYTPYVRAKQELRDRYAKALEGLETEPPKENATSTASKSSDRTFNYRPRRRGISRRSTPSRAGKSGS